MTATELKNLLLRVEILAKKNWLHALHLLAEAGEKYPRDPRIHSARGMIYFEQQKYREARISFQKSHEMGSTDPQVIYMLANSYFVQGEFRLALTYYNLIPHDSVELTYNRALCLANMGRNAESIDQLIRALALFPPQIFVYLLLVEQLIKTANFPKALEYVKDGEKRLGQVGALALLGGIVNSRMENWLHAYSCFKKADKAHQLLFPEQLSHYAMSASKLGLVRETIELYERCLHVSPYQTLVYEDYVQYLVEIKRYDLAKRTINNARKHLMGLSPVLRLLRQRITQAEETPGDR